MTTELTVIEPLTEQEIGSVQTDDLHIVEEVLAPSKPVVKYGQIVHEGFRFGCLGETGSGKTSLERLIVYTAVAKGYSGFALIHDTKGIFPEFPHSRQVGNVAEFLKGGGFKPNDLPVVSFRGDPRRDLEVSPEEVASFSLILAKRGIVKNGQWTPNPHVTVIEEAAEASTAGRKHLKSPSVLKILEQGRKLGVSLVWTTQSPRKVPLDMLGQSSSIAFFRLTGADANYLANVLQLPDDLVSTIRGPQSEGLPNFQFVLYVKGKPWDRQIYTLDKRTVDMLE